MAAAYLIWTILSSINQQRDFQDGNLGIGVVAMIFVFQLFYNLSIGPVLPTYILEVMPFTLRAKGYTIEQVFTYGAGLFNGFVNPIARSSRMEILYCLGCYALRVVLPYLAAVP